MTGLLQTELALIYKNQIRNLFRLACITHTNNGVFL